MGVFEKPHVMGVRNRRDGFALPAALFGLVSLGVLAAGIWTLTDLDALAARNREDSARALHIAEAGAAHALALLRTSLKDVSYSRLLIGPDSAARTADDGRLIGYGMDAALAIPIEGRRFGQGNYVVILIDDPADNDGNPFRDSNSRVLARCMGTTDSGAAAVIDVVLGTSTLPAIATDGNLTISGNPEVLGACGGAHANKIMVVSGTPTVQAGLSASDTVTVSGRIIDPSGVRVQPLSNQPQIDVPTIDPDDYCGDADFILRSNGYLVSKGPPRDSINANSDERFGWKRSSSDPVEWTLSGNSAPDGTVCAEGNVTVSGNPGSATDPVKMSIMSTGSINISGNPFIEPSHPERALFIAEGDVSISGNPGSGYNYEGLIYAGGQCGISGNPRIRGQILCKDGPGAPGSKNLVDGNRINGNPEITFDCGGAGFGKRRALSWYFVPGM